MVAMPDHVRIDVTDTGRGMKPEFLRQAFHRFLQEDASSTRTTDGRPLASASQVDAATHRPSADTERPPMTKRCAVDDLIALHVDVLHAVTLRDDPPV